MIVYQKAKAASRLIFELSKSFPKEETYSEQLETQHWVGDAADCKYITKAQENDLIERLSEIGRMLNSMINKADQFCGSEPNSMREEVSNYIISPSTDN